MKIKRWYAPRRLCVPFILVGVLLAGAASAAAEAEAEDYDAEDYSRQGRACLERGQYEEALQWYERGLALEPEDVYLHDGKATALFALGALEEAATYWDRALALRPDDWYMQFMKGTILWTQDRREKAVESYDQALKFLDGEYPYVRKHAYEGTIQALRELGRLEEVLETYDEALEYFPGEEDLRRGKASVLISLGRYEEAASYVDGPAEPEATPPKAKSGEGRVRTTPPDITGAAAADSLRSSAVIARIVNQRKAGIRDIYIKYLEADPNLEGELVVRFTVAASGAVTACSVVSSTSGNAAIDQEVCGHIITWRFPPIDAGDVDVVCPCVFFSSRANYVGGEAGLPATERYGGKLMKKRLSVAGKVTSIGGDAAGEAQRSPQVIARVIRRHLFGIEYVYNSALKKNPNLGSGKVTVRFTILASGSVGVASIATNTLGSPALSKGIPARVRGWRFPKVESGSVTVVYEFVFAVSDW